MPGLFVQWLYLDAPSAYFGYIQDIVFGLYKYFSIDLLTKTLFSPWRHDAVDMSRLPIRFWGQAIAANLISRTIGFFVRAGVIVSGCLFIFVTSIGAVIFIISWYLLPVLMIVSVIYGISLIVQGLA